MAAFLDFTVQVDGHILDSLVQDPSSSTDHIPAVAVIFKILEIAHWGTVVIKAILVVISLNLWRIGWKTGSVNMPVRGRAYPNRISSEELMLSS